MTFKGNPPTEPSTPQAPAPVPSELEIATKWDTCVENTIKSIAIGAAVTIPIFFFAKTGWIRTLFVGGGIGYGLGYGVGECRSLFSRPLDNPLVRVPRNRPQSTTDVHSEPTTKPTA